MTAAGDSVRRGPVVAPKLVAICGSTRFRAEMAEMNRVLTLAGYIVLAPGVFAHDGDAITDEQKAALDGLHLIKIDLADLVYVVDPGGYIGESTRREIDYATATNKRVCYYSERLARMPFRPAPSATTTWPACSSGTGRDHTRGRRSTEQ